MAQLDKNSSDAAQKLLFGSRQRGPGVKEASQAEVKQRAQTNKDYAAMIENFVGDIVWKLGPVPPGARPEHKTLFGKVSDPELCQLIEVFEQADDILQWSEVKSSNDPFIDNQIKEAQYRLSKFYREKVLKPRIRPATAKDRQMWLDGFRQRMDDPTLDFSKMDIADESHWFYLTEPLITQALYGAQAVHLIVSEGMELEVRTDERRMEWCMGHSTIYFMEDFSISGQEPRGFS